MKITVRVEGQCKLSEFRINSRRAIVEDFGRVRLTPRGKLHFDPYTIEEDVYKSEEAKARFDITDTEYYRVQKILSNRLNIA